LNINIKNIKKTILLAIFTIQHAKSSNQNNLILTIKNKNNTISYISLRIYL